MALTIKNPETVSLARELAQRIGMNQTATITFALRQALATIDPAADEGNRAARVDALLHQIWANTSTEATRRARQTMADLYDDRGLPA